MSIMITKSKNVPKRLYGYGDTENDYVDEDAPPTSTFTPTVPTDFDAPYPSFLPPELTSSQPVDIVKTVLKRSNTPYVVIPFLAFAALSDKLPTWARLVSALIGAGVALSVFESKSTVVVPGKPPCQPYGGYGCGGGCGCGGRCGQH